VSQDVQLAHRCQHLLIEEVVELGSDRMSLETRSPAASVNLVRVMVNDDIYIPTQGLHSQAQLQSALSGPFNIVTDEDSLTVTGSGETHTLSLPTGLRVTADTLVQQFRQSFINISVENDDGHLIFTDIANVGRASSLRITGTAADSLGFENQYGSRGRQVYPPWELSQREDTITNRYPMFRAPIKGDPAFKVTYAVPPQRCPRCRSTYVENDMRFDIQGGPLLVENENLLYQAALKILLTQRGSNPFHTRYGSLIMSRIGNKAVGAVATLINEDVQTALALMQSYQAAQSKFQTVTAKERLYSVLSVDVYPHETDLTAFMVDVVVSNASGEAINLSVVFSVPGAVALMGSNGLSLGLETTGLPSQPGRDS